MAIMDQDGANHRFLSVWQLDRFLTLPVSRRTARKIHHTRNDSYEGGQPQVYLLQNRDRAAELVGNFPA